MGYPDNGFGKHPPLAKASPPLARDYSGSLKSGYPFGQTMDSRRKMSNSSSTPFGSAASEQNSVSVSPTLANAHVMFGSSTNGDRKATSQDSGFAHNNSASISESITASEHGIIVKTTHFGADKRRKNSFPIKSGRNGLGIPITMSSSVTSFGGNGLDAQLRNQQNASQVMSAVHATKSNGSVDSGGGKLKGFNTCTTFGSAPNGIGVKTFSTSENSSSHEPVIHTAFGDKRRHSALQIGSETSVIKTNKTVSPMELRASGFEKLPPGRGKQTQGFKKERREIIAQNLSRPKKDLQIPFGPNADKEVNIQKKSSKKDTARKTRHKREKERVASIIGDEPSNLPVPSSVSFRDDSSKAELSAAFNLNGRCADMCSQAERDLHIRVDELSVFEKDFPNRPGSERDMIIKRFQRSSADHKLDIPEEIRPPGVLRRTQLYIEQAIMDLDQCGLDFRFQTPRVPEPIELYNFCWDRFRMIRKDFVLQNYRGAGGRVHPIALDVHERIARYHVLSEHELIDTPSFVAQQNMEQLGQTLKSLNELYDESHKVGNPAYCSPFEAEFRAYFILCTLDNGRGMDVLKYVKNLSRRIMESVQIKFAMRVFIARHTSDYFQFFSLLRQATYLQSCLLFRYIPNVRSSALLRMNRSYRSQIYPLEDLVEQLCFDDIEHAYFVCQEHHLRIAGRPGAGDDSLVHVKFGGEFETDAQLRRNNTPLQTRSSKIYVGMKQGNYLRQDICRGVTEYARDDYPALSKSIQDFECEERAQLYPEKPPYEDSYSRFVDFNLDALLTTTVSAQANGILNQHQLIEVNQKRHELDAIARKKIELERKKVAMLERMRELEKAKEEKDNREQAKQVLAEQSAHFEAQKKRDFIAQSLANEEVAEATQLPKQTQQREEKEGHQEKEEFAREAEQHQKTEEVAHVAKHQQIETLRLRAVEEERRQEDEKRHKELRIKAAQELEQQRQQELAEMQARQAREAALEAQRLAQLAKEQAEQKRLHRIKKQRLGILRFKLHLWKNYVRNSREGPGPVSLASKLRLQQPHQKAKDSMQWLFRGSTPIGTKRSKLEPRVVRNLSFSIANLMSLWHAEDMLELVGPSLRQLNPDAPLVAWKLVIADLLDEASSSFGLWCGVRAGAQGVSTPERDCLRTYHTSTGTAQGVALCSRYLDSTFAQRNTREKQVEKLAATSAILLPVDLGLLQEANTCIKWERQVVDILSLLDSGCRATLLAVGFASAELKLSQALVLSTLERCIERVQRQCAAQVAYVDVELVNAGITLPVTFGQVLKKIAELSPPVRHCKSVELKELLESNVRAMMDCFESSIGMQRSICTTFAKLRDEILSSGVLDLVYLPPELQFAIVDSPRDWNSKERKHEIQNVMTSLEVTCIVLETSSINRGLTCDVYFKKLENFIDRLFLSHAARVAVSTYELKRRIYGALLPIHKKLTQDGKTELVTPEDADVLLPWRSIYKEIYETFFETLEDIMIYYPTNWRIPLSFVNDVHPPAAKQPQTSVRSIKLDRHIVMQPVQVSAQSVRKSFGPLSLIDETIQQYKAVGEIKRLRVEIAKERAATSQFQHNLRQAVNRWND